MAAGQHNPSRRALLGAAVAIPLLPLDGGGRVGVSPGADAAFPALRSPSDLTPTLPSPIEGEGEWERALAAFEEALAAVRGIEAATAGCGFEEEEALLPAHDSACEAAEGALGRLLLVPVPDLAAFASKLELFFDHELEPHSVEEDVLAAIRSDARPVAGLA